MHITKNLLRKYSEGRCTPDETRFIEEWLEDGQWPAWEDDIPVPRGVRHSIRARIEMRREAFSGKRIRPVNFPRQGLIRAAAVVLLVATGGKMGMYFLEKNKSGKDETICITTRNNRDRITLSDSSVIFLGPSSSVKLQQPFPAGKREIVLTGEASFEVAKDPSRPFTVITGTIRTTALGTSFKEVAASGTDSVHVALSSGKVVVCNQPGKEVIDRLFLDPGEAVTYEGPGSRLHKVNTGSRQYYYKDDILYFKNAGIQEVMNKLEAYYHIRVRYDALKDVHWKVSGEFDFQPLDMILQNIAYTCNIRYTLVKDCLILEPVRHRNF